MNEILNHQSSSILNESINHRHVRLIPPFSIIAKHGVTMAVILFFSRLFYCLRLLHIPPPMKAMEAINQPIEKNNETSRFVLKEQIGEGTFGTVFRATKKEDPVGKVRRKSNVKTQAEKE